MIGLNKPVTLALALLFLVLSLAGTGKPGPKGHSPITLAWQDNILTIHHPGIPGGKIETWYLEAYCRPESTNRPWGKTVIGHKTKLIDISEDKTKLKLRCTLKDGVTVDHVIRAVADGVSFELIARNKTSQVSQAHWAQPCTRVGLFTGTDATVTENKYAYLAKSFIFQDKDDKPDFMPTAGWSLKARYTPGQVWCPKHVPRADVNPRPLHPEAPHFGLVGCVSSNDKWILALVWEPYQELFQGVIRCLHSDFRIGGLSPGESKRIRGRIYIVENNFPGLLARYRRDFPEQAK
jgi:hypothetical protein